MTASVLDRLTFGYQPLWGPGRTLAGIALFVQPVPPTPGATEAPPRAQQLLEALHDSLPHDAPPIFLVAQSAPLLLDLLAHVERPTGADAKQKTFATSGFFAPTVVVDQGLLHDRPALSDAVFRAHQRGVATMWMGDSDQALEPRLVPGFRRRWLSAATGVGRSCPARRVAAPRSRGARHIRQATGRPHLRRAGKPRADGILPRPL